jgi:hypothetical protein
MERRSKKLQRKFLPLIHKYKNSNVDRWKFVTLEGIRILSDGDLRKNLKRFTDCATRFLQNEWEQGGLGVLEHTTKQVIRPLLEMTQGQFYGIDAQGDCTVIHYQAELYVHYHAIVYGGFRDVYGLATRWRQALLDAGLVSSEHDPLEGKHGVKISQVRNLVATAKYVLKYVAKGVKLSDAEVELLTRLKYVRSWGILYNAKEPTYDIICMDCEAKCYVDFAALPIDPSEDERLHFKLVERPP